MLLTAAHDYKTKLEEHRPLCQQAQQEELDALEAIFGDEMTRVEPTSFSERLDWGRSSKSQ